MRRWPNAAPAGWSSRPAWTCPGSAARPAPDGVELITDDGLSAQELDQMDGVITRAAVAIAETGTIVLDAGPARAAGRSA